MKTIQLTKGFIAFVDDVGFNHISLRKWRYHTNGRTSYAISGQWPNQVFMHHLVLPRKDGFEIDHINGNGLDNRRENLRYVTCSENRYNRGPTKVNSSGYKGVFPHTHGWFARIKVKDKEKPIYLGFFKDKVEAAKAYNEAALKYHGEFAYQNPIPPP